MAPIEDYALLGDLHTAALLSRDGSIDWMCLPRFDSGACFAALLQDESAGHWRLAPACGGLATRRSYRDDTLIMDTEWDTPEGSVRVTDLMCRGRHPTGRDHPALVRLVEGLSGRVPMRMKLVMRLDYGQVVPWVRRRDGGLSALAGPDMLWLDTPVPTDGRPPKGPGVKSSDMYTVADFPVAAGDKVPFVLSHTPWPHRPERIDAESALQETEAFWTNWISCCNYRGRWEAPVRRALITLKALTYAPTGGIVAAATTSLPEVIGGERNWDYRYCWLRDATFTLQALLGTGYRKEADAWREWLVRAVAGDPSQLQIMYGVDGTRRLPELQLSWLSGYEGSRPVRIGNEAAGQFQLDVWGEVLDGLNFALDHGVHGEHNAWDIQCALLNYLEGHWDDPDKSLWEIRGDCQQFVHSKVMAWAGVNHMVHTAEVHGREGQVDEWRALANRIHTDVCEHGYDADRQTFTQFYGSRGLDAALLLIPRVGFLSWTDDRVVGTVNAVQRELTSDGLLLRYQPDADADGHGSVDGLPGREGTFLACTFWLADALYGIGRRDEATTLFKHLLTLRNDVGLLSEEYDTTAHRQVGNTPQAFSMVGLVNTALQLSGCSTVTQPPR
jgi:GH15 family glucan-1,4-alpha-glucosidase